MEFGKNGIPPLDAESSSWEDYEFGIRGLEADVYVVLDVHLLNADRRAADEAAEVFKAMAKDPIYRGYSEEDWREAFYKAISDCGNDASTSEMASLFLEQRLPDLAADLHSS